MAQRVTIDATDNPELRHLADEVSTTRTPIVFQADGEDGAIVRPLTPGTRRFAFKPTQEQINALRSAFGGWKGLIDPDELKAQIKAARGSNRPTCKL